MSIILQSLSKFYQEQLVVNKVSLEINDGELFVLLGGSGSGKSTILRLIAGLESPDHGRIELNGRDVTRLPTQQRGIGVVFQNYALFKHLTVLENIEFGLRIRGQEKTVRRQRGDELLEIVGLSGFGHRFPQQLSGGQQQRVAVARALAYDPSVLLLDEPFGALDVQIRAQVRESFRELQQRLKMTTILVTHDQEEAFELGNRIGVLERGKLLEVDTPRSLYRAPKTEGVATFIGTGNVLVGRVRNGKITLGEAILPFPPGATEHNEGAPVRVLFRPESVVIARSEARVLGEHVPLAKGILRETFFAGAQTRYRFELPTLHGARQLAPPPRYGQRSPVIEVRDMHLKDSTLNQEYELALADYHVLVPSGIRLLALLFSPTQGDGLALFAGSLASAGSGAMTLLGVGAEEGRTLLAPYLEEVNRSVTNSSQARIDARLRIGDPLHEVVAEAQEGFFEVVLMPRSIERGESMRRELLTRLVCQVRAPVMFVGASHDRLARILICTAGGVPGQSDVRLGGRIARQTGAFVSLLNITSAQQVGQQRKHVAQHLEDAQAMLYSLGLESEVLSAEGSVVEAILRVAREGSFDLIVVGTSGEQIGRITEDIIDQAACPVLVVPSFRGMV